MPEPNDSPVDGTVARPLPESLRELLFDRFADAVLVADATGRYVDANAAATRLLGYTREELLEHRIFDLLTSSERGQAEFERFTGEGSWRGHVEMRRKDGSTVLVEARATLLESPDGSWGVSILRESGEPLVAALAASEAQFEAIVQSSDDAVFSGDVDGRIWTWNHGAERMFGYTAAEMMGRHVSVLAPPERRHEVDENINRVLDGDHVRHFETTRQAKDGRRVEVSLSVSPILGPDGSLTGIAAIARDVSQRREAERRAHVLYELTHLLGRASTDDEVFDAALDALQRALHTDRASILLFDEERVMRFRAWRGLSSAYRAAVEGHNPWAPDDPDPRAIHVPDVDADGSLDEIRPVIAREGIRALSFVPLLHGHRLIGKFMLYFDTPRTLDGIDLQMATSIANQTAFAIARVHTEAALVRAHAQLELITVGGSDGITIQEEDGRVIYANDAAARLSGFDSGEAMMANPDAYADRWEVVAVDGQPFDVERLPGRRALAGEDDPEAILNVRDRHTGEDFWRRVRARATLVGGSRYAINLFHDITEQRRAEGQLRFQAAVLLAQAEASVEGILVVDTSGRMVSWNSRFTQMWSIPPEIIETRSDEAAIAAIVSTVADPEAFVRRIEELYADEHAEAADEVELVDGRLFERVTKPLVDESGVHRGRIWFFRDATDERRREAGQRLLADAGKRLASTFDPDVALGAVLDDLLAWKADVATLFLAEGEAVRMVGIRHRDPSLQRIGDELIDRFPTYDEPINPILLAIGDDRSMIVDDITDEFLERASGGGPVFELARRFSLRSALIAPIRSYGGAIGAISVGLSGDRRYDQRDAIVLEELAERIAVTFDNARLYRERDFIAHTLQTSLLPSKMPDVDGLDVAARYLAAGEGIEVGGDFYDLFEMRDGSWAVAVGDVCGKGPTAAALTGVARHTIRAGAMMDATPSAILALVNDAILRESPDERFCTVLLARLAPTDDGFGVRMSSGGHPPALILRRDGSVETVDEPGTLLGLFEDPHLTETELTLSAGDTMILYTDGVTDEQCDGEEFGEARLHDVIRASAGLDPEAIAERLVSEVVAFNPDPPRDDIAVLVLRAAAR
jgi:PAS domain S-box-containing protein